MTNKRCLTADQLLSLLDGELTENAARSARAHAASCARCGAERDDLERLANDVRGPVLDVDAAAVARAVNARIDAIASAPRKSRPKTFASIAAVAACFAVAGGLGYLTVSEESTFAARGGSTTASPRRDIGITPYRVEGDKLVALEPGGHISSTTALTATYRSRPAKATRWLLLFAVDAQGELHWLSPAFTDAATNPSAVPLPPGRDETPLPTAVVLDHPARGTLRIVSIVTTEPTTVSAVEATARDRRTGTALRTLFPNADVQSVSLVCDGP